MHIALINAHVQDIAVLNAKEHMNSLTAGIALMVVSNIIKIMIIIINVIDLLNL